jgi:hypothetical protein
MAGLKIEFWNNFFDSFGQKLHPLGNLFFQKKTKQIYFTTLNQLPMTGLKILFLRKKIDREPKSPPMS